MTAELAIEETEEVRAELLKVGDVILIGRGQYIIRRISGASFPEGLRLDVARARPGLVEADWGTLPVLRGDLRRRVLR